MSQTGADDSEVVFEQPGKSAEVMEQEGLIPSRHKEETWFEDTQPHHGAQRRAMEFDRPVDEELGAALGGVEDKDRSHDDGVPELHPEQQIQNEEEIRTPPCREPRRVESLPPKGPREEERIGFGSGVHGGTAIESSRPKPTIQRVVTGGNIGKHSVSNATGPREFTDRKSIFEDTENNRAHVLSASGGTDDNKGSLV